MGAQGNKCPDVSIITPAYNAGQYIAATIESVMKQSFSDWEMIIVDDASTDETGDIAKSFSVSDARIRYIRLEANSGRPAVPRNHAIAQSRGRYLAFLDADDVWYPDKLETQVRYLNDHISVGLVFCDHVILAASRTTTRFNHCNVSRLPNPGLYFECLCTENPIGNSTVMMRRDLVESHGLLDEDVDLRACEDYEYWFRFSRDVNFGFIRRPLVIYRALDSSISHSRLLFARRTLLTFEKVITQNPAFENKFGRAVRKGRSVWCSNIGYAEFLDGKKGWRRHLLKALRYDPLNRRAWGFLVMGAMGSQFAKMLNEWLCKIRDRLSKDVSGSKISPEA